MIKSLTEGNAERWTADDFAQLQGRILDETGVMLSVSTLPRIWGRVDWRQFKQSLPPYFRLSQQRRPQRKQRSTSKSLIGFWGR